ncbi:MAG: hypothetical protein IPK07_33275 [Deltaproteobacteria bacterium]|nr:hypothetical protein [Deltaproteobacteria bacterium]
MSDAAGEGAERLHLLGARELLLGALAVGDVAHERERAVDAVHAVGDRRELRPEHGAVEAQELVLGGAQGTPLLAQDADPLRGLGVKSRLDALEHRFSDELIRALAAEERERERVEIGETAVALGEDAVGSALDEGAEALVPIEQLELRDGTGRARTRVVDVGHRKRVARDRSKKIGDPDHGITDPSTTPHSGRDRSIHRKPSA